MTTSQYVYAQTTQSIEFSIDFNVDGLTLSPVGKINDPAKDANSLNVTWDWGDHSTPTKGWPKNLSHTYSTGGEYVITITSQDDIGTTSSITKTVSLGPMLGHDISSPISANMYFQIDGFVVTPHGNIHDSTPASTSLDAEWDWGDGFTTSGWPKGLSHTYSTEGAHTITLAVQNNLGQQNTFVKTITVGSLATSRSTTISTPISPIITPPSSLHSTNATSPTIPSPPIDFTANIVGKHIYLSWKSPTSDGGSAITEYIIMRDTTPNPQKILDTVTGVINSYEDSNINSNQQYYYQIIAKNSVGQSDPVSTDIVSPNIAPAPWYEDPLFIAIMTIIGVVVAIIGVLVAMKKKQP